MSVGAQAGDSLPVGGHDEVLYESARTRVTRSRPVGRTSCVVQKQPRGQGGDRRLRHERALLERLADVPGVVRLAAGVSSPDLIALEDVGGTTLAEVVADGPISVPDLLEVAYEAAMILAGVHHAGVIHRDLSTANILWDRDTRRLTLIDFDLATVGGEELPAFAHPYAIAGTLAYLAPEQTGRTGWPVDQRADLYGFGAVLYELATGQPPFGFGGPLELVHDHLARVPEPPVSRNPGLPAAFSQLVLRLLEKEPDLRYQSAQGLAHDLLAIRKAPWEPLTLGTRDFPARLSAPSRLVGRKAAVDKLVSMVEAVRQPETGRSRCLLITGAPGVGKSVLVDQLRSIVANREGWFVAGKFDPFRRGLEANAAWQAMSGLCRLLLAEPEEELARLRTRLLGEIGPNIGLTCSFFPELAPLLGFPPVPRVSDPLAARVRIQQGGLGMLAAVASPQRPVVMVLDDLQWAQESPLSFLDAVLTDPHLAGVLVVGTYRESDITPDHPLTALLERWRRLGVPPERLRLTNLPAPEIATMVSEMLRLPEDRTAPLANQIAARTGGNPYDIVELVDALRRDDALVPTVDGWLWDSRRIRSLPWRGDVLTLLGARLEALPAPTVALLEIMACLGGEVDAAMLADATGKAVADIERDLVAAMEDGLIVASSRAELVRFRHDRMQEAAFERISAERLIQLRLALGRRLAALPHRQVLAAEQYLPVAEAVHSPDERRDLVAVFRTAAREARRASSYARSERFLSAAATLLATTEAATPALVEVAIERHSVLYSLGKLVKADQLYEQITDLARDPMVIATATTTQISSLTSQNRPEEAVALGLTFLASLGCPAPRTPADLVAETERQVAAMYAWTASGDERDDLRRDDCQDQRFLTIATIINRMAAAAFRSGYPGIPWLLSTVARMWVDHGPAREFVGPLSYLPRATPALPDGYRIGAVIVRRVLAVSEARGYEPETSHARSGYAFACAPWFEPLEDGIALAHQSYEGLIKGGEPQFATHAFFTSLTNLLACARTLDEVAVETETALAFALRTSNAYAAAVYVLIRQFTRALQGETAQPPGPHTAAVNEQRLLAEASGNLVLTALAHALSGITAAILDDSPAVLRHGTALVPILPFLLGLYASALARLVVALALVQQIRKTCGKSATDERAGSELELAALLDRFDSELAWFTARAADAPANFEHFVPWLEAERAWALDDFPTATSRFDAATLAVAHRQRRWQRALILERSALCYLDHGLAFIGHTLLGKARRCYQRWGATEKVHDLDRRHPILQAEAAPEQPREIGRTRGTSAIFVDDIDLLGVVNASLALSSETNLDRLRIRVKTVLQAMTGATEVWVALWNEDSNRWFLSVDDDLVPLEEAAAQSLIPLSVFRYVERTAEPLVTEDATQDARFAKDPYFSGVPRCSLLAVPILSRGTTRALVVLENQLSRNAFAGNRLDNVLLIAGQLAVSVDNALLYTSLERKVTERTAALAVANQRLETLSVTDSLTGLANRRRLADVLDLEWQRALRPGTPLGFAMIDIDYFKAFNDLYGHPAGDHCLRRVAAALNETVRATDLVARYGGEEFAVVMPGVNLVGAKRISERMRAAVMALKQPHGQSPLGVVTISVGVAATVPSRSGLPTQLIDLADHLLYEAKNHGRNQVAFA